MTTVIRRQDIIDRYPSIEGEAMECLLRETAKERHKSRVEAAKETATTYVASKHPGLEPEDIGLGEVAGILLADIFGVGGKEYAEGVGTKRHPGLESLGKGRKHATDGGAWDAAIRQAFYETLDAMAGEQANWRIDASFCVDMTGDEPVIHKDRPALGLVCDIARAILWDGDWDMWAMDPQWAMTIAREGLRRAARLEAWFPQAPISFQGSMECWATLVNKIHEKLPKPVECRY